MSNKIDTWDGRSRLPRKVLPLLKGLPMEQIKPSVKWFIETQSDWFIQNGIPEWFHGIITRKEAEDLLQDKTPGCFLIRVGESRIGYSLSYRAKDRYRHFMIDVLSDQQYTLAGDTKVYNTLEDLVKFHTQNPLYPYNEILTQPCGQKSNAAADYRELFETIPETPVQTSLSASVPTGIALHTVAPPLPPPRSCRVPETSAHMMNISSNPPLPPSGNRLYPVLPTEYQISGNTVSVLQHKDPGMIKPNVQIKPPSSDVTDGSNSTACQSKHREKEENVHRKPLKAYRKAMTKAKSLVTEGEIAQDLKKMENAVATQFKNVKENIVRLAPSGQKNTSPKTQHKSRASSVPDEYRKPPPFNPGF
ncbi:hematopoietic SH2 domain-containing protein isoform X2 [Hyperolius riggenbachi]|uniref:hematopoietic SH2 domain-containing protein isoform X2 n=1 Tax=Hyperolius riggenbachi TaxID=752182 RepID=UPI0035A36A9D